MSLPGQTSPLALIASMFWAVLALFILIIGHVVWAFIAYGMMTATDALKDLETFLPILGQTQLYILAGLAIVADIWIFIGHKKERTKRLQR